MKRRLFTILSTLSLLLFVAVVVVVMWPRADREFDPAVWRDQRRVRRGVRLAMADQLVARKLLSGRSRAEVVEMLGEPLETKNFRE